MYVVFGFNDGFFFYLSFDIVGISTFYRSPLTKPLNAFHWICFFLNKFKVKKNAIISMSQNITSF